MTIYQYIAKRTPQERLSGTLEAASVLGALQKISSAGLFPVEVKPRKSLKESNSFLFPTIGKKELTLFSRHLADLLESGLSLPDTLETAQHQTTNKFLRAQIQYIRDRIHQGDSLGQAMKKSPEVFPPLYVHLVQAGEVGGFLAKSLDQMAQFLERETDRRSRISAAMAYPLLIATVGWGTILYLLTAVVPRMVAMFGDMGQSLPWMTQVLANVSAYIWKGPTVFFMGFVVLSGLFVLSRPTIWEKARILLFKLPLWGPVSQKVAFARFAETLALLLEGGVPLTEALGVVSKTLNHPLVEKQLVTAIAQVEEGKGLANSLKALPDFPPFVAQMISIGEEGNLLEKSLRKVAQTYDREAERSFKWMTTLLEPLMILTVGLVAGGIIIAMLLPIFDMQTLVQ